MIITIGVAAEAVRLSVASEEVEVSEEAEVLAAAASEEEWAEAAVPAPAAVARVASVDPLMKPRRETALSVAFLVMDISFLS